MVTGPAPAVDQVGPPIPAEDAAAALTAGIYALLPLTHAVIDEHRSGEDGRRRCRRCQVPQPCELLEFAMDALDLVLRTHHRERRPGIPPPDRPEPQSECTELRADGVLGDGGGAGRFA